MKNFRFLFIATLIIAITTIAGCKKKENTTGDLIVNVKDGTGDPVTSAIVYLYVGVDNYNNRSYDKTEVTDNNGQVKFLDLAPDEYYVDCDYTNILGGTTTVNGHGTVVAKYQTTITIEP